jgi:outer membrane protein OmpA-like peptidoglycan-associated protein
VEFLGGSAYLTTASKESLLAFAAKLESNPELHVRIESHTYPRGDAAARCGRGNAEALRRCDLRTSNPGRR